MKTGTKARRYEGTEGDAIARTTSCLRASVPSRLSRPAFTLTEILIVIGIIVLLLALAVPAMRILSGGRSIDGAENKISALLGRARGEAIGLQRDTGIMFYYDPDTDRTWIAEVFATDFPNGATTPDVYLDLVPERDFVQLPAGVEAQVVDDCDVDVGVIPYVRRDDGFIGYNNLLNQPNGAAIAGTTIRRYGGVILFDANGQVVNRTFAFRATSSAGGPTPIFNLLYHGAPPAGPTGGVPRTTGPAMRSQFGLVLYDRDAFLGAGFDRPAGDPQVDVALGTYTTPASGQSEQSEETWIDQNSVPLMINRFNGTLIRGE